MIGAFIDEIILTMKCEIMREYFKKKIERSF